MNLTSRISLLELIWTISSFIACVFGLRALIRAYFDLRYLERIGKDHLRKYVAVTAVISLSVWTFVPSVFVYVGAVAMATPQAPGKIPVRQMINLSLLIAAAVVMGVGTYIIDHRRRKIVTMIEEEENE